MIACVKVPHFAAAIHRREVPELGDAPLAIANGSEVLAVCEIAAFEGVRPGMTLSQAEAVCSEVQTVPAIPSLYQSVHSQLVEVLAKFSPTVEAFNCWGDTTSGTVLSYLDLGELKLPEVTKLGQQIIQDVSEQMKLYAVAGLARGKFPAYVAASRANGKPVLIEPRREREFLSDLPVTFLPLDRELTRQFHLLGLRKLDDLAILLSSAVLARFGRQGQFLQRLAQGRDKRPLIPHRLKKQEQVRYATDEPVDNWGVAEAILTSLAEELACQLQMADLVSRELSLRVRFEDGSVQEATLRLQEPVSSTKYLAEQLVRLLKRIQLHCGLVELVTTLAGLVPALGRQLELIPSEKGRREQFDELLSDLMQRYGPDHFYRVEAANRNAPLIEQRYRLIRADAA